MENSTILDTGTAVFAGNKLKGEIMENRCSVGNESRKGLSDISNLQQQHEVLNQGAKLLLQPDSIRTKEFIDKLQQENMMLMKVLADRKYPLWLIVFVSFPSPSNHCLLLFLFNDSTFYAFSFTLTFASKVIKLSGIELQKLRINLEKFQQQNLLLAQANSQMLAELNLSKDRLKALKHELGCKDAVLKAIKLELGTNKCGMEVESHKEEDREGKLCNINRCSEADESHEEDQGEDKPGNTNRKRQSYCLGTSNIKPVQVEEGVKNKRVCSRRHSARRKAQEPETTESVFEVDDQKFLVSSTSDDKVLESGPSNIKPDLSEEGIDNKSKVCSRRQSARPKAQEPETTEDVFVVDDPKFLASSTSNGRVLESAPSNIEPSQAKEAFNNKRRQSVTRKDREPEATGDIFEVDDKVYESVPSDFKSVRAKAGIDNKRACLRRQSGRFKPRESETSKDVLEVDDARIPFSSTGDDKMHESGQLSSDESSVKSEHDNRNMTVSSRTEAQELRRVSAGRPLRRAVEKVQSYKEMKLNVKMRRKE